MNWLIDPPAGPLACTAKIRYRHAGRPGDGRRRRRTAGPRCAFAEPQTAVTPGQAVVFYDGNRVLGGGWIEHAAA